MDFIRDADETFEFDKLALAPPNGMSAGNYLTKITYLKEPLYVQTPKTTSKQGVIVATSGKKAHIDLMFTNDDTEFIGWMSRLEETIIQRLYDKRNLWFNTPLEMSDIENMFVSPIRAYRGGKNYLVRVGINAPVPGPATTPDGCAVFDENEQHVALEYIKPEHKIISIIMVRGVKFSARSFQFDLLLKQLLVVPDKPLFGGSCVIKRNTAGSTNAVNTTINTTINATNATNANTTNPVSATNANASTIADTAPPPPIAVAVADGRDVVANTGFSLGAAMALDQAVIPKPPPEIEEIKLDIIEKLQPALHIGGGGGGSSGDSAPSFTLKEPSEVYRELYRAAKQRAKEAKKHAIDAYLEVKNIKATYNLDDLEDSDEDSDFVIEDEDEEDVSNKHGLAGPVKNDENEDMQNTSFYSPPEKKEKEKDENGNNGNRDHGNRGGEGGDNEDEDEDEDVDDDDDDDANIRLKLNTGGKDVNILDEVEVLS